MACCATLAVALSGYDQASYKREARAKYPVGPAVCEACGVRWARDRLHRGVATCDACRSSGMRLDRARSAARAVQLGAQSDRRASDRTALRARNEARRLRICSQCSTAFESASPYSATRYCPDCRTAFTVPGSGDRSCARCGGSFSSRQPHARFCSRRCSNAWHGRRGAELARRRSRNAVRRLRPLVIERDGLTCYLCRSDVDPTLAENHPMALTVDHVVPVSRGGDNTLANLRIAHRRCNVDKGDEPVAWWLS